MKDFFSKKMFKITDKRGFTVIEAFVGITILLIGVVGPMTLVNRNFQAARFSRDQITAYYLAQEAIEIVRQVRDDNLLRGRSMLSGFPSQCTTNFGCRVNAFGVPGSNSTNGTRIIACTSNNCQNQKNLYNTNGRYSHDSSGELTRFSRYIKITNRTNESEVRVIVEFDTGKYRQEYETISVIANWVQQP